MKNKKIIITIPAYNEEKTIGDLIKSIHKTMKKTKYNYEIICVNDGSTDKTAMLAKKAGATIFSHPYNYGLAETFRTEMEVALKNKGDIIVHIDADFQYKPEDIPKMIEPIIKDEADLVLGSRFMGHIDKMPFVKRLGNILFSKVISNITKVKITDCQTGFRTFTNEFARKIKIISDHTYTQEMIIKAIKEKFRVKEIPVYFGRRLHGKSRLVSNPFTYALKAWITIFRIYRDFNPLRFFGLIGGSLMFIGFLLGLYLFYIFLTLGFQGIDGMVPTILLTVLFLTSGLQIILFGFFVDKFKV